MSHFNFSCFRIANAIDELFRYNSSDATNSSRSLLIGDLFHFTNCSLLVFLDNIFLISSAWRKLPSRRITPCDFLLKRFRRDMIWNDYTESIAKSVARKIDSFFRVGKYLYPNLSCHFIYLPFVQALNNFPQLVWCV